MSQQLSKSNEEGLQRRRGGCYSIGPLLRMFFDFFGELICNDLSRTIELKVVICMLVCVLSGDIFSCITVLLRTCHKLL